MAWLLHQGPSPMAAASSTASPLASSAAPDRAPSLNHQIHNLQILQYCTLSVLLNIYVSDVKQHEHDFCSLMDSVMVLCLNYVAGSCYHELFQVL